MNQRELGGFRDKLAQQYGKNEEKAPSEPSAFYTGKPYLASTDTYAFKYRNYNPALARWTSEDPSGFPDGANNSYYAPTPTSEFDYEGLWTLSVISNRNPNRTMSGRIDRGFLFDEENIKSSSSLFVQSERSTSINVRGTSIGDISPTSNWQASVQMQFTVTVDSQGIIRVAPGEGSWSSVDNGLQVAATYNVTELGDNKTRLTFLGASIYEGSGLSSLLKNRT